MYCSIVPIYIHVKNKKVKNRKEKRRKNEKRLNNSTKNKRRGKKGVGEKGRRSPQKKKKKEIKDKKKKKRKIKNGITTQKNKTREKVKWEKPRQNGQNGIILTHKPVIIFSLIIQKICFGCSKEPFSSDQWKVQQRPHRSRVFF